MPVNELDRRSDVARLERSPPRSTHVRSWVLVNERDLTGVSHRKARCDLPGFVVETGFIPLEMSLCQGPPIVMCINSFVAPRTCPFRAAIRQW